MPGLAAFISSVPTRLGNMMDWMKNKMIKVYVVHLVGVSGRKKN